MYLAEFMNTVAFFLDPFVIDSASPELGLAYKDSKGQWWAIATIIFILL